MNIRVPPQGNWINPDIVTFPLLFQGKEMLHDILESQVRKENEIVDNQVSYLNQV